VPTFHQPAHDQPLLFEDEPTNRYVTVRDAISDLPATVLPPEDTQTALPYPTKPAGGGYRAEIRATSTSLTHHSAKRMLGIRRLRLALLRPGDYGTSLRDRLKTGGLPQGVIDELFGGLGLRDIDQCRKEDRRKEEELRALLSRGHIDATELFATLDSGGFANKYRRLEWDKPSHTLVAHMARDCSDFIHPEVDRFVSVREAARLQSFPDSYHFPGSQFQQFKQIGNAVPPLLGAAVAKAVLRVLRPDRAGRST